MSNGTKHRIDIMSKVRKAKWEKMSNGKNVESKKCREDKMSKMVKNVESKEI